MSEAREKWVQDAAAVIDELIDHLLEEHGENSRDVLDWIVEDLLRNPRSVKQAVEAMHEVQHESTAVDHSHHLLDPRFRS